MKIRSSGRPSPKTPAGNHENNQLNLFLLSPPHLSDRKHPAYRGFKECDDGVVKQRYTECRAMFVE